MATDHNFKVKNGLVVDGGEIYLQGVATPQIFFNGNADAGIDMAIKATPESLDFYEPEDNNKLHMRIVDDAGVNAVFGFRTGAGDGTVRLDGSGNLQNIATISSGAITSSGQIMTTQEGANSLKSRFLMGKASGSTADGPLYLQYGSADRVYIGSGSGGAGLTVAGTISSGAITSTAAISGTALQISSGTVINTAKQAFVTSVQHSGVISFLNGTNGTSGSGAQGINVRHVYAGTNYSSGTAGAGEIEASVGFKVAGNSFINSSRNITAGTISSGAITSTGKLTLDGAFVIDTDTGNQPLCINRVNTTSTTDTQSLRIHVNDSTAVFESEQDETDRYGGYLFTSKNSTNVQNRYQIEHTTGDSVWYNASSTAKMLWDASAERLGINTTTPATTLDVNGAIKSSVLATTIVDPGNPSPASNELRVSGYGIIGNRGIVYVTNSNASGQIVFGISGAHNANPKLTLTTSSATFAGPVITGGVLTVNGGTPNVVANFISTDSVAGIKLQDNNGNVELSASGSTFRVQPSGSTPVFEIGSSGAITSTVTNTGDATFLTLHHDSGSDLDTQKSFIDFSFEDDNTNETPQVRIGAQVGQNANADSQEKEGSGAFVVYTNNAESTSGAAGASLAERMRVDYQGNVLIGKTASDFGVVGAELAKDGTPGKVQITRASNPLSLSNLTDNGNIISFYKGSSLVGDIGIEGGDSLYIQAAGTTGSGLRFHPSAGSIEPVRNGATIHNTISLGTATRQFKDAYFQKVYVRHNTAQAGAVLEFSDEPGSWSQNGFITFRHLDTASYGSGAMLEIGSDQDTTTILAQGKLYFSEGLYTKPASGTGLGTLRISSSGNATLGTISSGAITSGAITSSGVMNLTNTAVTGAIMGTNRSLGINATEAQIHLVAENSGDWASNIVLTNGGASPRHYWIHNAPSTASVNAGKFELRTSTTTDANYIGGQGTGSSAILTVDTNGDLTSTGINRASRYIQTGSSASNLYAAELRRSGSSTTTPDIWGTDSTFVIGTSSSVEAIGLSGANATVYGTLQTNSNISINNSDGFVYLNNDGVGNAGIYVRGIGSSDTLRSHSTDNFRWEVLGSQKMELNSSGQLDVLDSYKLNGGKFVTTKEYNGTGYFASSGDWHTLCTLTESNTPAYFTLKMAAHSTITFVATMGYHGSNVANINVLSSTWTANGGYPHPNSLRILKDSSNNYKLQMQMTYTSLAGFYMYVRVWGAGGPESVPTLASSLGADTATGTTITSGVVGRTGATNLGGQYVKAGSNSAPSYSFHEDDNTGMYRDTTDSIGFASNGTQRVTISNSGLDVKSGTLRMNGQEVISAARNLSGAAITGSSLNVTGLVKFGDTASSPAADIEIYGTGNNFLRLRGTAGNDFEIDLQGTSSIGNIVFNQFDLKTNNNIIIDGSSKYLIIENHAETDTGIIFNDGDASTGGNWNGSSSQAFKIQYHCGNETLIMGHDDNSYAGFNFGKGGALTCSGNITAYSDERLKENIQTLDGSKVLQMRGVSFTKEGKEGSGVIAQELEKVAPELVSEGEYKSVAYGNLVGYLIENAKQQQKRIEKLEELIHKLMSEK